MLGTIPPNPRPELVAPEDKGLKGGKSESP